MSSSSEEYSSASDEEMPQAPEPKVVYTKDYDLHAQKVPTKERVVKEVEMPPADFLADSQCWLPDGKPNVNVIKDHLKKEGRLSVPQAHRLISMVYDVFCAEQNVLQVPAPVTGNGSIPLSPSFARPRLCSKLYVSIYSFLLIDPAVRSASFVTNLLPSRFRLFSHLFVPFSPVAFHTLI